MSVSFADVDASWWSEVRDASSDVNWLLLGFAAGEKKKLKAEKGSGGMTELISNLREDEVRVATRFGEAVRRARALAA